MREIKSQRWRYYVGVSHNLPVTRRQEGLLQNSDNINLENLHFLVIFVNNPRVDRESVHHVCRSLLCGFIVQFFQMISAFAKDLEFKRL